MISINSIREKRGLLHSLAPFSEGVRDLKRRSDLLDFAYSDLRLYGSILKKEGVRSILEGNTIPGVPAFEHRLCESHRKALSRFNDKLDMKLEVDAVLLNEFCTILSGAELPPYREGTALLYHLDFVPGDDDSITSGLAEMFAAIRRAQKNGVYGSGEDMDFCMKAADIHMGIVKIYPYKDSFSELAARAAMQYELVKAGYFPVDIGVSEPEYNRLVSESIKSKNTAGFAALLQAAVLKKIHFLIDAVERGI